MINIKNINIAQEFKTLKSFEIVLICILILFIVAPVDIPFSISEIINSPLGIIILFCLAVYLFFNSSIIIAVMFVFSAMELIRRTYTVTAKTAMVIHTPTQVEKDAEMAAMTPPVERSLEEEIISMKAPIGVAPVVQFVDTSFKPIMTSFTSTASKI